jgi:hypothetical protein
MHYFIDCLPIIGLQYLVSLLFKNFLVPVGGGFALWILSVSVLSWKYGYLFPYTYCGLNYLKALGKYHGMINIHLMATGYFFVFTVAGYVLYIIKKEKG